MISPFRSSFFAVALGLLALTSGASASSSHSSLNHASLSKRATTFVDPSSSLDFSSTVPGECSVGPCTEVLNMDKSCNADKDCTSKLLCTTAGLNSLVKCNGCVLQLANRTTGVNQALYDNVTSILTSTSTFCTSASLSAKPDQSLKPFSEYTHTAATSSSSTNTTTGDLTGDGLSSEGVGAAGTPKSGAGFATLRTGGAWVAAVAGVVAVMVV